ncbi:hypothetical protein F2Q69_00013091 [Brassica cretica]|uniref:Uncharacterized protein n=1 Tax=Brassica cretica TaxID=69181 RepID=A0A8S9R6L8_BRACR|nr:hypothetical protein F2Q69_00013091 [Brassica cretica]
MVGSGLFTLLKVECDKIRAAPYEGCLRTLVEGSSLSSFVLELRFLEPVFQLPVRPLRSSYVSCGGYQACCCQWNFILVLREDYELSSRNLTLAKRQILGSRIRMFDTMPRDARDQCTGFRAKPRLIMALGGAMTTSTYVSRITFNLIPSHFKVRDMFSAYVTCMVGIEHLFGDNF